MSFKLPSGRAVSNKTSSQSARWPRSTQGIPTWTRCIFHLRCTQLGEKKKRIYRTQLSAPAWMDYSLTGGAFNKVKCTSDIVTRKRRHYSSPRSSLNPPNCAVTMERQTSTRSPWRNSTKGKSRCLSWGEASRSQDHWRSSRNTPARCQVSERKKQ